MPSVISNRNYLYRLQRPAISILSRGKYMPFDMGIISQSSLDIKCTLTRPMAHDYWMVGRLKL